MGTKEIKVIETATFLRNSKGNIDGKEKGELLLFLAKNPEKGVIIPKSGGLRKIRWAREGKGKRGGFRVIYYYYKSNALLLLISMYAKNEKENTTPQELKAWKGLVEGIKKEMEKNEEKNHGKN